MDLAGQDARLQQLVGRIKIEIVSRNNTSQRFVEIGLNDLVNHTELVAELTVGSGLIQHPEGVFPKTATHRKNRIILGEESNVVLLMADGCACQVSGDLAQIGLHDLLNGRLGFRLLGQNDLTNDRIDIGIGEFHADGETSFELLQVAGTGHGRLTGADEEEFAANVFAAGFHRLLDIN